MSQHKSRWLSRNLIQSTIYFALFTNEKMLIKELKRMKVSPNFKFISDSGDATTHFLFGNDGARVALVCFFNFSKHDLSENIGLLCHEAVHIWQEFRDSIGEKFPSSEFEAYSIQSISTQLIGDFFRQTRSMKKEYR